MDTIPTGPPLRPLAGGPGAWSWQHVGRLAAVPVLLLLTWQQRARERAHLRGLSDRMLNDVGLSRADVDREASKPFWQF